jgi:hypothetical protein
MRGFDSHGILVIYHFTKSSLIAYANLRSCAFQVFEEILSYNQIQVALIRMRGRITLYCTTVNRTSL